MAQNTPTVSLQRVRLLPPTSVALSAASAEYNDCISAKGKTPPSQREWPSRLGLQNIPTVSLPGGVTVSKLDEQTYTSEFESHWVPHSFGLVPHRSKELCKLPLQRVRLPVHNESSPVDKACRIHRLCLCKGVRLPLHNESGPVGKACRIHRLYLCKGVRLPKRVSWYVTLNNLMVRFL